MAQAPEKDVLVNRRARHDFHLIDSFEAGISLVGSEVKSLRAGNVALADAHVVVEKGGAWLRQLHIAPWPWATQEQHDPTRPRALLLHRAEIEKLRKATREQGMTIVLLRVYLKGPRFKAEIAIAKGKKLHDKREAVKKRDAKRDMERGES